MEVETLRMLERIISVIIGGLSIFFGYRLFLSIPHEKTAEGKINFPGVSIHFLKTGPGVFFALFGCLIVFWSFANTVAFEKQLSLNSKDSTMVSENKKFSGVTQSREGNKLKKVIYDLNNYERSSPKTELHKASIHQMKLVLIRQLIQNPDQLKWKDFQTEIFIDTTTIYTDERSEWKILYNIH